MTLQIELKEDMIVRMNITPGGAYLRIVYRGVRGYQSTYVDMHVVKAFGNVREPEPNHEEMGTREPDP